MWLKPAMCANHNSRLVPGVAGTWPCGDQTNDGIFDRMIDKASPERVSPPVSYARKDADGFWYVAVTWGGGRHERLGPYKTEALAQEHIKAQLDAWHDGQNLFRKRTSGAR
jgi:hypothetical protein